MFEYLSHIWPLEVKAEENLQSKSLKVFNEKYDPPIAFRTSMSGYREQDWLLNIPLYAISGIFEVVKKRLN